MCLSSAHAQLPCAQALTTGKMAEDFPAAYWKLTQYFDLLKWCVRGPAEKLIVRLGRPFSLTALTFPLS